MENVAQLSPKIADLARGAISSGNDLPLQLAETGIFVGNAGDSSISAIDFISVGEKEYAVGPKKEK